MVSFLAPWWNLIGSQVSFLLEQRRKNCLYVFVISLVRLESHGLQIPQSHGPSVGVGGDNAILIMRWRSCMKESNTRIYFLWVLSIQKILVDYTFRFWWLPAGLEPQSLGASLAFIRFFILSMRLVSFDFPHSIPSHDVFDRAIGNSFMNCQYDMLRSLRRL